MYFTTQMEYAATYSDGNFIVALLNPGNPFPVTEDPYQGKGMILDEKGKEIPNPKGYLGKPNRHGYQSHYVVGQ